MSNVGKRVARHFPASGYGFEGTEDFIFSLLGRKRNAFGVVDGFQELGLTAEEASKVVADAWKHGSIDSNEYKNIMWELKWLEAYRGGGRL